MYAAFISASSKLNMGQWNESLCCAFGSRGYEGASIINTQTNTDEHISTDVSHKTAPETPNAGAFLCTTGWHCSPSLINPPPTSPLPPPMLSFSLLSFSFVSSSCVGGRLELPESATRITRSISETISFSYLFYMVPPSISVSSLLLSLTCSLVNLCFHPLPFKALNASEYIYTGGMGGGWCTNKHKGHAQIMKRNRDFFFSFHSDVTVLPWPCLQTQS